MTLIFDEYVASLGPGVAITESRKNCQLNLALLYPPAYAWSVLSADYRGYAYLDPGIAGQQKSIYYFSGQTAQANVVTSLAGPYAGNYLLHDSALNTAGGGPGVGVWSPCDGSQGMLNVDSAVSLQRVGPGGNGTAQGLLTTDSIDTKFTQVVYLVWEACRERTDGGGKS